MNKIEILVECANCGHKRTKSYEWLRQKHLPCPNCSNEVVVNSSHIAIVEKKMQDALKKINDRTGTYTVTLRV